MAAKMNGLKMRGFSIVVAKEKNGGIGYNSNLPWPRLKTDLDFLRTITTTTQEKGLQNAVIMGRTTWESIPHKFQPLAGRFNVVLSSRPSSDIPKAHLVASSLTDAMMHLRSDPLASKIENVYILGGTRVYKEALESSLCEKIYLTEILHEFPSDVFWPGFDETKFKMVEDSTGLVPKGTIQEEGISYKFHVFQRSLGSNATDRTL